MEKLSGPLGLLLSFALILMGIGSPENIANFIDPGSIAIVVGGTIGSVFIAFGIKAFVSALQLIKVALTRSDADRIQELVRVYNLSTKARKKNLLALEEDCAAIEDDYLRQGLQMVIDGISPDTVQGVLNKEIENINIRHTNSQDILNFMGEAAPSFGMVGTLVGLVGMLQNLSDPDMIGPQMAVALLTTFYGAVLANVIFIPLARKLEKMSLSEMILKEAILEGLISIQSSESPSTIEAQLSAYLSPTMKNLFKEEISNAQNK